MGCRLGAVRGVASIVAAAPSMVPVASVSMRSKWCGRGAIARKGGGGERTADRALARSRLTVCVEEEEFDAAHE